jgi:hypothetical protein
MPQQGEIVDGDDERGPGRDRRPERRAVQDVDPGGGTAEAERVPQRVATDRREAAGAARLDADELEVGSTLELAEQTEDVARGAGPCLDERRRVDRDPQDAALRTASRGSG